MAIYYFDPDGGNNANDGLSFANRKKDWAGMGNGSAGDEWRVMAARDPHSLGNGQWTNGSNVVTLAAAKAVTVDNGDAAWTASASVTCTTTASAIARVWRQGTGVARAAIVAAFTTGIIAYKALGATLDLSAYRGLSLSMGTSIAVAAGVLRLDLCSDAAGAVPVASMLLPAFIANAGRNVFVDFGAALPSNVNSIALYAVSDPGTVNIDMDNIVAVHELGHADHICHNSMIGKETSGEPELWPIRYIDGANVCIGAFESTGGAAGRLYPGVTESVTTYCQQTQVLEATPTGGQDAAANMIMTGGWNRTDMSTQGATDTFLSGQRICSYAYQRTASNRAITRVSYTGFVSGIAHYSTFAGNLRVQGKHCSGMGSVISDLQAYSSVQMDYCVMNTQFGTGGTVNPEYVACNIKLKLWGECNGAPWASSFVNGWDVPERNVFEFGKIRNCAVGWGCNNYSGSVSAIPLRNTILSGQGNTSEYNNRYSYNFENVTFTRTEGAYWYNTATKLVFTKKDGDARICGWANTDTALEVQSGQVPPTGDTVAWRFRSSRNVDAQGKYPRGAILSFGAEAGKNYTVTFDGRRASASNGYIGRLEAEESNGTITYDDIDGTAGSWVAGTFNFTAAVTGPVTLYLAKPVDVGSNDHNCYAANIVITEA